MLHTDDNPDGRFTIRRCSLPTLLCQRLGYRTPVAIMAELLADQVSI